ncbi:hypothetical protein F4814DRAFT_402268 [Daldinia grandis]|nr:hypothetical protein F4814DRAFT_402268 [Daldinia grandis]
MRNTTIVDRGDISGTYIHTYIHSTYYFIAALSIASEAKIYIEIASPMLCSAHATSYSSPCRCNLATSQHVTSLPDKVSLQLHFAHLLLRIGSDAKGWPPEHDAVPVSLSTWSALVPVDLRGDRYLYRRMQVTTLRTTSLRTTSLRAAPHTCIWLPAYVGP